MMFIHFANRSLRSSTIIQNKSKQRRFLLYSIYGWGAPLLWIIFTLIVEKYKPFPSNWNPTVTVNTCFFNSMCFHEYLQWHSIRSLSLLLKYMFNNFRSIQLEKSFFIFPDASWDSCYTEWSNFLVYCHSLQSNQTRYSSNAVHWRRIGCLQAQEIRRFERNVRPK